MRRVEVRHLGTVVGELAVVPSASRPLGTEDLRR
jgi:hypothetical protein